MSALAEARAVASETWAGAQQIAETIKRIGNTDGVSDQILGAALSGEHKYDASIAAFQNAVAAAPSAPQPMADLVASDGECEADRQGNRLSAKRPEGKFKQCSRPMYCWAISSLPTVARSGRNNFKAAISSQPKTTWLSGTRQSLCSSEQG